MNRWEAQVSAQETENGGGLQARHHRRSLRLKGYDYAQAGAYFVTICTQDRACLFGKVADETVHLNEAGQLAEAMWADLPTRYPGIELDVFVVMPNHIHGIVVLPDRADVGAPLVGAQKRAAETPRLRPSSTGHETVGHVVGAFKSLFTVRYIQGVQTDGWPRFDRRVWQRNYYEHVIRDEVDLSRIRSYIDQNPLQWRLDSENPENAWANSCPTTS
jgi:REP element-mobilizing transposase RayT